MCIQCYFTALLAALPLAQASAPVQAPAPGPASRPAPSAAPGRPEPPALLGLATPDSPAEALATDRPDFTESTETVTRGRLQLEGGYTFTIDNKPPSRARSHTAPELLLRVGLLDGFELRIGWEGYTWLHEPFPDKSRAGRSIFREDWSQGGSDLYLGFKHKLFEQDGPRPHFALIPAITAPSGSAGWSSGDVDPEVKLAWAYDLAEGLSLAGNVNFAAPTDQARRFFQSAASVSLAIDLLENVGAYVEYFGFYPAGKDIDSAHTASGGLTWRITENLQLDWRAGIGLNGAADDFFTGVGFAVRW
jgi:hypothetical protein